MTALSFQKVVTGLYEASRGDHHYELDSTGTNEWAINYGRTSNPGAGMRCIGTATTRRQATHDALAHFTEVIND